MLPILGCAAKMTTIHVVHKKEIKSDKYFNAAVLVIILMKGRRLILFSKNRI